MSAHHLTIAKASFAAGLLRPDITKVGRDDLTVFHNLLEAAITTCTTRNIQKCKEWIAANIAPSAARSAALGKYLTSFSKHTQQELPSNSNGKNISASRKKLHVLYLLHDVAHHTKYHTSGLSAFPIFTSSIQPFLVELVQSTTSEQRARVQSRVHILFEVWENEKFYSRDFINKLRTSVAGTDTSKPNAGENDTTSQSVRKETSEAVLIMPATHGDPATPFYDLPAGNLLPFLEPGSSVPMRPEQIKPLQFPAGPANKPLVNTLKDFLKDVESIEHNHSISDEDSGAFEIDKLGQVTFRDGAGDITGDTYYGWSRSFCEKMKRRRKGLDSYDNRHRSRSRGSSRSSSRSPRKRRRYTDSEDSRSRSRSLPRFRTLASANVSRDQASWQTPQAPRPRTFEQRAQPDPPAPPVLANLPPNPVHFPGPPFGPNGIPVPPPRPPNWSGPWPPPPPGNMPFPPAHVHQSNRFPPPPPPPPPGYPGPYGQGYR